MQAGGNEKITERLLPSAKKRVTLHPRLGGLGIQVQVDWLDPDKAFAGRF